MSRRGRVIDNLPQQKVRNVGLQVAITARNNPDCLDDFVRVALFVQLAVRAQSQQLYRILLSRVSGEDKDS